MSHRKFQDEIVRRRDENQQTKDKRDAYWRTENNRYFTLFTDSMLKTNPGMRELLRERFAVGDGYYAGFQAMTYLTEWFTKTIERQPDYKFYEDCLETLIKNRLPAGASVRMFQSVVRGFVWDINAFLRAPYEDVKLGEFIIKELMPPYIDAQERLLKDLRRDGTLGDVVIVEYYYGPVSVSFRSSLHVPASLSVSVSVRPDRF